MFLKGSFKFEGAWSNQLVSQVVLFLPWFPSNKLYEVIHSSEISLYITYRILEEIFKQMYRPEIWL